jgi:hypothetical protein
MAYIPQNARWYLANVIIEHTIDGDARNVVHVNTHLIEADSPEHAYGKAMTQGRASEQVYTNTDGREVRLLFRGLEDLNVIHDPLEDGAELTYTEEVGVSENDFKARICLKEELGIFRNHGYKRELPNYMPESVMRMLEAKGFDRENLK